MTDDLDDLKQAMQAATPAPDAGRKAANFTVAQSDALDAQFEARMAGTDIVTDFGKGDRYVGTVKAETNGH